MSVIYDKDAGDKMRAAGKDYAYFYGGYIIADHDPIVRIANEYKPDLVEFDSMLIGNASHTDVFWSGASPPRLISERPGVTLKIVNSAYLDDAPVIEGFAAVEGEFRPADTHEIWRYENAVKQIEEAYKPWP